MIRLSQTKVPRNVQLQLQNLRGDRGKFYGHWTYSENNPEVWVEEFASTEE